MSDLPSLGRELPELLLPEEAAEFARVSSKTLLDWTRIEGVPGAFQLHPRLWRYRRDEFLAWARSGAPAEKAKAEGARA